MDLINMSSKHFISWKKQQLMAQQNIKICYRRLFCWVIDREVCSNEFSRRAGNSNSGIRNNLSQTSSQSEFRYCGCPLKRMLRNVLQVKFHLNNTHKESQDAQMLVLMWWERKQNETSCIHCYFTWTIIKMCWSFVVQQSLFEHYGG